MKRFMFVVLVLLVVGFSQAQDTLQYPVSRHYENVPGILRNRTYEEQQYQLALQKYLLKFSIDSTTKPIALETRHPLSGTAGPLAALATLGAAFSFLAQTDDEHLRNALTLLGILDTGLAMTWWVQAFRTEQWVVYSNGTAMRVDFVLK